MNTEFSDRLRRAERMDPEWRITERPLTVHVESASSDETYAVVPNVGFCTCPDFSNRRLPCKHVLFVATSEAIPADVRFETVDGIEHRFDELTEERNEAEERFETVREQQRVWADAAKHFQDVPDVVVDRHSTGTDSTDLGQRVGPGVKRVKDTIDRVASTVQ